MQARSLLGGNCHWMVEVGVAVEGYCVPDNLNFIRSLDAARRHCFDSIFTALGVDCGVVVQQRAGR